MYRNLIVTSFCLLAFLITDLAKAQDASPFTLSLTNTHELKSDINSRTYNLSVALPNTYAKSDTAKYPVLYILDGNFIFPSVAQSFDYLSFGGQVRDIIIVGIGVGDSIKEWYINRTLDFTPTSSPKGETFTMMPPEILKSGGAPDFLNIIRNEIIPFVEEEYRVSGDRGIWGHSFGGLFAAYALFEAPGLFDRYGLSSPSVWWDEGMVLKMNTAFAGDHSRLPAQIFLSVGSKEKHEINLVDWVKRFSENIESQDYKGLEIRSHIFENETHLSVIPAAVSRALRVLYSPNKSGTAE